MKYYVNLQILFCMVHLCNLQISAASAKHRLKGTDYDIDGFVSQLFASRRLVELVDKLSEEAANRIYNYKKKTFIVGRHGAPVYNEKGTESISKDKIYDIDGFINEVLASKNIHELLAELTVNAVSKMMRFNANSELKTRTESTNEYPPKTNQGKIELQAIIKDMLSLSENPQLKYDDDESDTNEKVQSKEETNKNDSNKKPIELNKPSRNDANGHYGKADPNRYSESSHISHGGINGEEQENSKKKHNYREEQGSGHINSREEQNSEHKVKGIGKQKTSHMDKSIREDESLSSLDEENHYPPPSAEKTNREVTETKEETEHRSMDKKIIVNVGHEDSMKNNKMVSGDNSYHEVDSSKSSEDSGDRRPPERPQEHSIKDRRYKEQSVGRQVKPIIRIEGGKQYTYVQDADYAEYHEKLAEWRKTHPENATELIF